MIRFILNAIHLARKPSRAVEGFSEREGKAQSELTGAGGGEIRFTHEMGNTHVG